ncbi:PRC-barrel domain-containing protein [Acetobacter sp.]|uniref:PRC-barrel domain-containing protein n=1 Tax=Acetobacter sp. TaxID=440 RepID=UPI0039ED6BD6
MDASRDMPTGDNPETVAPVQAEREAKPATEAQTGTLTQAQLGGLIDRDVKGPDGSDLGHIVNVLVDARGTMQAVVLDVGGFLGVGNRQVVVATALLHITGADRKSPVIVRVPAAAIRAAPAYRPDNPDVSVLTGPIVEENSAPEAPEEKAAPTISVTPSSTSGGGER